MSSDLGHGGHKADNRCGGEGGQPGRSHREIGRFIEHNNCAPVMGKEGIP